MISDESQGRTLLGAGKVAHGARERPGERKAGPEFHESTATVGLAQKWPLIKLEKKRQVHAAKTALPCSRHVTQFCFSFFLAPHGTTDQT